MPSSKKRQRAELLFHEKLTLNIGLIREIKIWKVPQSSEYAHGLKYSLALVNPEDGAVLLLYDNHAPKGPHVHRESKEESYRFQTMEKLIKDFRKESEIIERKVKK